MKTVAKIETKKNYAFDFKLGEQAGSVCLLSDNGLQSAEKKLSAYIEELYGSSDGLKVVGHTCTDIVVVTQAKNGEGKRATRATKASPMLPKLEGVLEKTDDELLSMVDETPEGWQVIMQYYHAYSRKKTPLICYGGVYTESAEKTRLYVKETKASPIYKETFLWLRHYIDFIEPVRPTICNYDFFVGPGRNGKLPGIFRVAHGEGWMKSFDRKDYSEPAFDAIKYLMEFMLDKTNRHSHWAGPAKLIAIAAGRAIDMGPAKERALDEMRARGDDKLEPCKTTKQVVDAVLAVEEGMDGKY